MTPQALLLLYGWIPFTIYLFMRLPPQRAAVISFVGAFLFLPMGAAALPSPIPSYTKVHGACYGVLLGTLLYHPGRFSSFKPGWLDVPMLIWCLCPIPSQLDNGLSPLSPTLAQIVDWGVPYFVGRLYFSSLDGMRQLAVGIFIGGLSYIPFTLIESFRGPILHAIFFGYQVFNDWSQARRLGGWRPVVFTQHGLMLSMWMMSATLIGLCLWKTGLIKKLWGRPVLCFLIVLGITFYLCRSTGAYNLLGFGVAIMFVGWRFRTALLLFLLIFNISSHLYKSSTGTFAYQESVTLTRQLFGEERANSLEFRYKNEDILSAKARQKAIFGWGASGGSRVFDEFTGRDISVTDSYWIIVFGVNGTVGLISWAGSFLLPAVRFCMLYPARYWSNPKVAPVAAVVVVIVLYMDDCLLNAMIDPVYTLAAGGVAGLGLKDPETLKKVKSTRSSIPRRSLPQVRQQQPH